MKFSELYKLYTLLESPDSIIDPKTGDKVYYYNGGQSWSGYLINADGGGHDKFILHTDAPDVAGHYYLTVIIKYGGDPDHKLHKWFKRLRTNIPVDDMRTYFLSKPSAQFRIWSEQKVMSFWKPWDKSYLRGIENALKNLNQNPEDYIYEFNGATAKTLKFDYACYDYTGLQTDTKLKSSSEEQAERREDEWEEDKRLLAQIKMGMKPTLNNKPRSIFNQGEGD